MVRSALGAPVSSASLVRAGETLEVHVAGEPSMSKSYLVDSGGSITLEMVGPVRAAGRTTEQIAQELRLRLRQFLKNPSLSVTRHAPTRQEVLVTGEVARPGAVALGPGAGILDALTVVGGLSPRGDGARATIVRRGHPEPIPVNLEKLAAGDMSQNVPVMDGDIVQVPRKEGHTFQIVGEVKAPGTRTADQPVSVLDALVAAGGLTERADRNRLLLTRPGEEQPIVIDLDRLLAGGANAAPKLQGGDVLQVGARLVVGVAGEVKAPGERLLRNGGTLMEAIMMAGGFGPDADRAAILITHRDGTTETVSLEGVTGVVGGPELRSGDLVVVSRGEPRVVTVTGAVRNVGAVRYKEGMKLSDALMIAGLVEQSNWKKIRVLRDGEDGRRQIVMFDLEKYLKSPEAENVTLKEGDQIFVEARRQRNGKNLLQRLIGVMPLARFFFF